MSALVFVWDSMTSVLEKLQRNLSEQLILTHLKINKFKGTKQRITKSDLEIDPEETYLQMGLDCG